MTLIQTIITDDLIIQVADRRLTKPNGELFDDAFTKLVCWNMTFTVGFTHLARIDPAQKKSTSEWIAETLCNYPNFEAGVEAMRREAERRISKLPADWDKRLAIILAGFDNRNEPIVAEVANFEHGGPMPTNLNAFHAKGIRRKSGSPVGFNISGAPLTQRWQCNLLLHRIPRVLKQPDGLTRAVRLMVALQRKVAETNTSVGTDAMSVTIPRTTPGDMILSNMEGNIISTGNSEFHYFDTGGFNYRQLGPHIAAGGGAYGDCLAEADPLNPANHSVEFRLLKVPGSEQT